jgi:hypothetical protein
MRGLLGRLSRVVADGPVTLFTENQGNFPQSGQPGRNRDLARARRLDMRTAVTIR